MRRWFGTVITGGVGLVLALLGVVSVLPPWATIIVVILFGVGSALLWPVRRKGPQAQSAFVRGNVSNSRFTDVSSNADAFINGDVHETLFRHITHRPRTK